VNRLVQSWASAQGYTYKGVCSNGEVPVPTTFGRDVKIDALLEKEPNDRIWVEAKGEANLSDLIQGSGRLIFAVYYGGGKALLAIDRKRTARLLQYIDFLKWFAGGLKLGLFNVEDQEIRWL